MEVRRCVKTHNECYGYKELTLLFDISTQLMRSREITEELPLILKKMCEYLHGESAFLNVLERESSKIYIEVAHGLSPAQTSRGKYNLGEGIIGRVVETAHPVVVQEISKSRLFLNKTKQDLTVDGKELTFICVPIMQDSKVAGALSMTRKFNPRITIEEDKRLLSIIGSLITQAVRVRQDRLEEIERLKKENQVLHERVGSDSKPSNMIGNSSKMQDVYSLIDMVSPTNSSVLIRGESGCGKELVADAIHRVSQRKEKPFIKVNCSALPDSLIESELFGHEKGAFTGAEKQRKGRFEMADGGTIFLDEIGDIPLTTQVKILRILQEKEFERLGGTETIKVNVRIICATNKNLEQAILEGTFREDLFYRINVFPLFLPSLRDRRNDIPPLVDHFISKFNKVNKTSIKRITTSAINMLMVYSWPGNVRELENVIERACILTTDNVIHSYNLPPTLQTAASSDTQSKGGLSYVVEKIEKQLIIDALIATKGNIAKAATELLITERMLGSRIQKYKLDVWRYKV
ncbi:sigma 54-interacting transcriptional regulator [Saccharicrinis sp. FJH62]|uniref:sigma-54-dependent Fis family transcriptional regulator n=1 Tax=Saccharicrinis sp. FJH62 TaxID=3344657 RepID=UPI0035D483EB